MPIADTWNPNQYERFAAERRQPFDDLLALVQPIPGGRAVDLGCGTGELTVDLHRHTGASRTLGIDTSEAMLATAPVADDVTFEVGDLTTWWAPTKVDLVFGNASLQWTPDHEHLLGRLAAQLAPGGQLAIQVPWNFDHASHLTAAAAAADVLADPPADPVAVNVLPPERYAELLHELGFAEQHVRLQVYGHVLASTADVVEWTKGTSLTRFRAVMAPDEYDAFVDSYRDRLVAELGDHRPYFYAFKRILFWARLPV
jgi:trans-aconitate 2-methyltransferase